MTTKLAAIHVKKVRGRLIVYGTGQTPTGQTFIKGQEQLKAKSMADPAFKDEMHQAVAKLFDDSPSTG